MPSLAEPQEQQRRRARRKEPHVAELNRLVDRIRRSTGEDVPSFDPDSGGVNATGLVLGQDPSSTALATGFISPDNPDPTAASTSELTGDLPRMRLVFWNAVPWRYTPERLNAVTRDAGAMWLAEAVSLLPALRVVMLLGVDARNVWTRIPEPVTGQLSALCSPHLSRRGLNRRRGEAPEARRDLARAQFEEFRLHL